MAEEKPKRIYIRQNPLGPTSKRGARLRPVLHCMIDENVTVTELAERLGMSRQGVNLRLAKGDCALSEMEKMAKALGYKFEWKLTKIEKKVEEKVEEKAEYKMEEDDAE